MISSTDNNNKSKTKGNLAIITSINGVEQVDYLSQILERYLMSCRANGLSPTTLRIYTQHLKQFKYWFDNEIKLKELIGNDFNKFTGDHIIEYIAFLKENDNARWGTVNKQRKEKLATSSILTYTRALKILLNWMEQKQLIERNPFNKDIKVVGKKDKVLQRHNKVLQHEQLTRIFQYLVAPERMDTYVGARNLAIISLLLDSGMRRGELLSIKIKDFDWIRNRVTIRGKTGERVCFYSKATEEALTNYKVNFRYKQVDHLSPDSGFWLKNNDEVLGISGIEGLVARISRESKVHFHAHQLRHTFASLLVGKIGIYELKELLGHSSVAITEIYLHSNTDKLQDTYRNQAPLATMDVGQLKSKNHRGRPKKYD